MRIFTIILCALSLLGCSLNPKTINSPSVEVTKGVQLQLPQPNELGYSVTASQLVSAAWGSTTQQLPVQLEVKQGNDLSQQHIVLAGFSSWGTRILSLEYINNQIKTSVLSGLEDTLPKPEQVLFNLMLTLWPMEAWHQPLAMIDWNMVESENTRTVYGNDNQAIIKIIYHDSTSNEDRLAGNIEFQHLELGYTISIQTLNFTKTMNNELGK
ncbi:DUF3261 domain-containing protein [Vibrio makurazakiensis]|uniref:DUF3261 domain-containing protein n=1 Tax=Vibrio makurazakiensis TaxID=2910250 RepID=UPI003D0BF55E